MWGVFNNWSLGTRIGAVVAVVARLRLQVEPADGGRPYEVGTRALIDRFDVPAYQPGERIGVLVDPRDPRKVAVLASG